MAAKPSTDQARTTLAIFPQLPDSAGVRVDTVTLLFGISEPTAWRWSRLGKLPAPQRRCGVTTWNVGDLRRALASPADEGNKPTQTVAVEKSAAMRRTRVRAIAASAATADR